MIAVFAFSAAACKKPTVVINEGTVAEGGSTGGWYVDEAFGCGITGQCKEAFEAAAADAGLLPVQKIGARCKGFRVVAPSAPEAAALEINGGADAPQMLAKIPCF